MGEGEGRGEGRREKGKGRAREGREGGGEGQGKGGEGRGRGRAGQGRGGGGYITPYRPSVPSLPPAENCYGSAASAAETWLPLILGSSNTSMCSEPFPPIFKLFLLLLDV